MRLITIYETFDHEQFPTFEEALHYEYEARKIADLIRKEYVLFLDETKTPIAIPEEEDLWEQFFAIEKVYNNCEYVKVLKEIPSYINEYLSKGIGIELPAKTGLYIYDWSITASELTRIGE